MGFWSNLAIRGEPEPSNLPSAEWAALFGHSGVGAGVPLGTARWLAPELAVERLGYTGSLFTDPARTALR